MTGHRESWYLDRLRTELERVAEIEDRRERRGALGRLRVPRRSWLVVVAAAAVIAVLVLAVRVLQPGEQERTATPSPTPAPTATPAPDQGAAILRRLDGVYVAEITSADLDRFDISPRPPAGVWKFAIHASDRTLEVSEPEDTGFGGFVLDIVAVERGRLTFGPDRTCELPEERSSQAVADFAFGGSMFTFTHAQGGCTSDWAVLTLTPWRKA